MQTLRDIGELAAIERMGKRLPSQRNVILGTGDDCAIVRCPQGSGLDLLLTSDPVIQGTHFTADAPLDAVGRKAVGRALSDIAAMGGDPQWALLDIAAPAGLSVASLDELYHGACEMAAGNGLAIVGGDLAEGPVVEVHVFLVGAVPSGRAVLRSGASPGDHVFVTGTLGGSGSGRHLAVEPRVAEGIWLREWATAMIDVSDGLASDLRHLTTSSRTGCEICTASLPVAEAARREEDHVPALDHVLHDGEDFELLFTIPEDREDEFAGRWRDSFDLPVTRIGLMTAERDLIKCVFRNGRSIALEGTGYAHFS